MQALTLELDIPGEMADGKRRLIDAALRLAAGGTAFSAMGIRELAREAGLNHNTFYRHFGDIEELALAAAEVIAQRVMSGMRQVRAQSSRHADATVGAVEYFLDFVAQYPAVIATGVRELHGGSPGIRGVMRRIIEQIARESVEQIETMNLVPGLPADALLVSARAITYLMLGRALEVVEDPSARPRLAAELVQLIRQQFLGALALQKLPGGP